ncbi:hypothetical protein PT300_15160 [Enterobacteriaceae bacterium ESL0689]|nr:hypothetical protein [Enterobacteriaceae bacterium ESL0689]
MNKGHKNCIGEMQDLAKVRRGYAPHVMPLDLMPELELVKNYHNYSDFYQITELPELKHREIPDEIKFHAKKYELFLLLLREQF